MITEGYVCGIDVGAARLDVALYCDKKFSRAWAVENNEAGIADLVHELSQVRPELVIIESTGGYEREVTYRIYEAGVKIAVVNPRHTRHFAEAMGVQAKQDAIDARLLAEYGIRSDVEASVLKDEESRAFSAALARRRELVVMRTAEMNRLKLSHATVRGQIRKHIEWLTREIEDCEKQARRLVEKMPVWKANA
jgi:transposase